MRVLVTWGSKRGGTEGIARIIGDRLREEGVDVQLLPAREATGAETYDAVIVGGALYANRWHAAARRFVNRQEKNLRRVPVWFFSSGPLDDSAERRSIPPTPQVQVLMERVGARGHVTFGGRLAPDARGFPASAMAKTRAGDWRRPDRIGAWASAIAASLPVTRPGVAITHPGRSLPRLVAHGVAGWAACAAVMGVLLALSSTAFALVAHAVLAPIIFLLVSRHYFRDRAARDPLPTAGTFTAIVALLDLVLVGGLAQRSLEMFRSIVGFWLPLGLIFAATAVTGSVLSMLPLPEAGPRSRLTSRVAP